MTLLIDFLARLQRLPLTLQTPRLRILPTDTLNQVTLNQDLSVFHLFTLCVTRPATGGGARIQPLARVFFFVRPLVLEHFFPYFILFLQGIRLVELRSDYGAFVQCVPSISVRTLAILKWVTSAMNMDKVWHNIFPHSTVKLREHFENIPSKSCKIAKICIKLLERFLKYWRNLVMSVRNIINRMLLQY